MKSLDYEIEGSGGMFGGGGGGESDPNSLRSKATVKIVDLLGEGEIRGLVDGGKSIYLDETPLIGREGQTNFNGLVWTARNGLPNQQHIEGFSAVEAEVSVSTKVLQGVPVVRSVNAPDLDAIKVTVRVPSLYVTDEEDGTMKRTSVQYRIEVQYTGGSWIDPFGVVTIDGKCVGAYDRQHRIELPKNPSGTSHPWNIRMTRVTADSNDEKVQNDIYFASYTTIIDSKFSYPNSALMALAVDGEQFGQSVPNRRYEVYGRIIRVPTNYNPETRAYTGIWNGVWKWAWTDNPAWVFYDVLTNDRFGLGEFIDLTQVDKWSLYQIAVYCDQLIPNGYGQMEPRFTFNGVLSTQQEAYNALQSIASAFRGMAFWSSGTVMASQDRPQDAAILATPANVIGGIFTYQSSALKARHTVAIVEWADPAARYDRSYEPVYDHPGILRYGYNETRLTAVGCTNRAQAHRYGEWALFTELNETQVVTYQAGMDHAGIRPGDIVAVQDPAIAMVDFSGRIASGSTNTSLILDHPVTFSPGQTYSISVVLPDGEVHETLVSVQVYNEEVTEVFLTTFLPEMPVEQAIWVISSNSLQPQLFKVVAMREVEPHIYEISGVQHEPGKFDHVDLSADFDPAPVMEGPTLEPPHSLIVRETLSLPNNVPHTTITVSWQQPQGWASPVGYTVTADTPEGRINYGTVSAMSVAIANATPGAYKFYIASVNLQGKQSIPATVEYVSEGWVAISPPSISTLRLVGGSSDTEFIGKEPSFTWNNVFPGVALNQDGTNPFYAYNTVHVYNHDTNELLREERVYEPKYTYTIDRNAVDNATFGRRPSRRIRMEVSVSDIYQRDSAYAWLIVNNPVPDFVTFSVTGGIGMIAVRWPEQTDPDTDGVVVWRTQAGLAFDPDTELPVYDGVGTLAIVPAELGQTYDIYVAAYDSFGKVGLNIAGPFPITVNNLSEEINEGFEEVKSILFGDGTGSLADIVDTIQEAIQRLAMTTADSTAFTHTARVHLTTTVAGNKAEAIQQIGVVATEVEAVAQQVTALQAQVGEDVTAAILAEQTARATADEALALDILQLAATTAADLTAAVLVESEARANSEEALAASVIETAAQNALGDLAGGLFKVQSVATPVDVSVRLALLGRVSTGTGTEEALFKESGILIDILPDGLGSYKSRVAIKSDQFVLTDGSNTHFPFSYEGGMVFIDSAMIRDLTAVNIMAKSITTDLVKVAGRAGAINLDPYFEDETFWDRYDVPGITIVDSNTAYSGGRILRATGPVSRYYDEPLKRTPINPGKVYSVQIAARRISGTGSLYGVLHFYDADGNALASTAAWVDRSGVNHYFPNAVVPASNWDRYVLQFGPGQPNNMPVGTAYVGVGFLLNYTGGPTDVMELGMFRIVEGVDADLVVKGSIRADHLGVTSLSSITANIGDVTAGVVRSLDNKFIIDLNNKFISIEV